MPLLLILFLLAVVALYAWSAHGFMDAWGELWIHQTYCMPRHYPFCRLCKSRQGAGQQ